MRGWQTLVAVAAMLTVVSGVAVAARQEAVRLQGLALLTEPRDGASMVRALRAGETVTVLGRKGVFVEVSLSDGTKGYVQGGFLTGFDDIAPVAAYASRIDKAVVRPAQTAAVEAAPAVDPSP